MNGFRKKIDDHHDRRFGLNSDKTPHPLFIKTSKNSADRRARLQRGLSYTKYSAAERAEHKRFNDFCLSINALGYNDLTDVQFREVNEIHKTISMSGVNNRYSIPAIIDYLCTYGNWNQKTLPFPAPVFSKKQEITGDWVKSRLNYTLINSEPIKRFCDIIPKSR